ncbi:hypothetical protein AL710_02015 [Clostridium botulinum]|uniref:hypothetical protein n=1 Tax=Clostridium botulinum TaxID=1491 RepID=UPI00099B44D6|nr:hypothetical protein [Clostridium botulinum]OPD25873.1 hypothetical protein AL710_02015 [Clostridium botulinum]
MKCRILTYIMNRKRTEEINKNLLKESLIEDEVLYYLNERYMVDCSNYVIAIYNGNCKGGTYNCIQYAKKQNKTIITLNPITLREGKMKFS